MLSAEDKELISLAQALVKETKIKGGIIKEVGGALRTAGGAVFTGVSLHLSCGIGFCAEHSAVAKMLTETNETIIDTIVASRADLILPPCGRCRELISLLNDKNFETNVIISPTEKIALKDLLPYHWKVKA